MPKYDVTLIVTLEANNEDEAFKKGMDIMNSPDEILELWIDGVEELEEEDEDY